jgi:hypothetical protein
MTQKITFLTKLILIFISETAVIILSKSDMFEHNTETWKSINLQAMKTYWEVEICRHTCHNLGTTRGCTVSFRLRPPYIQRKLPGANLTRDCVDLNPLAPSDPYMGRTAQLTSRCCILNTYSTIIRIEYFKCGA